MKWQEFPRASDVAAAQEEMSRVGNVNSDVMIAREENMAPAEAWGSTDSPREKMTAPSMYSYRFRTQD